MVLLRDPDYAESCAGQKEYDLYLKSLKKVAVRLTEKFIKHLSRDLGRHCRQILGGTWKTALKQLPSTGECPWPGAQGRALFAASCPQCYVSTRNSWFTFTFP